MVFRTRTEGDVPLGIPRLCASVLYEYFNVVFQTMNLYECN